MTRLVCIASPLEPSQALPLVSALRAQGIDAGARNLEHGQIFPSLRLALGGFPVYVPESQADAARTYLNTRESNVPDDESADCPECRATSRRKPWRLASWLVCIPLTVGIEMRGRERECTACGHVWNSGSTQPFTPDELGYDLDSGPDFLKGMLKAIRELGMHRDTFTGRSDP